MISNENQDLPEIFTKFSNEKTKEWNDISLNEMLGKFSDLRDLDKKDKWTWFHYARSKHTVLKSTIFIFWSDDYMETDLLGMGQEQSQPENKSQEKDNRQTSNCGLVFSFTC